MPSDIKKRKDPELPLLDDLLRAQKFDLDLASDDTLMSKEDWDVMRKVWPKESEEYQSRLVNVLESIYHEYLDSKSVENLEDKRWYDGSNEVKHQMEIDYERGGWGTETPQFDVRTILKEMQASKYEKVSMMAKEALGKLRKQSQVDFKETAIPNYSSMVRYYRPVWSLGILGIVVLVIIGMTLDMKYFFIGLFCLIMGFVWTARNQKQ